MIFLRFLPFSLLLLVLLAGAWWRGLYFEDEQVTVIFLLLIATLCSLIFNWKSWTRTAAIRESAVFLLPLVLLISAAGAVSPHGARMAWMQFLALAGVFVLLKHTITTKREQHMLQAALLIAASLICLFGLIAKAGAVDFPAAVTKGRIGSVFQYPNAFGMFSGACLLGSFSLLFHRFHPLRTLALLSLPVLFYGLVFSFSRGAWLLVVPVFLFLVWLQNSTANFASAAHVLLRLLPALLLLPFLPVCFRYPVALVVLIAVAMWLSGFADSFWSRFAGANVAPLRLAGAPAPQRFRKWLLGGFLLFAFSVGIILAVKMAGIGDRLLGTSAQDSSFTARLLLNQDAWQMFLRYPLTGAGGGAWITLYESFQSQPYFSTQVHNFFLQVLTDAGVLGVVVFVGVLLFLFYRAVQYCWSDAGATAVNSCFFLAVASMILLHSLLDFDLSFYYLAVVLFACLAAANPFVATAPEKEKSPSVPATAASVVPKLILGALLIWVSWGIVLSGRQLMAIQENRQGNQLAEAGKYAEALTKFEAAAGLAPYHLGYRQAEASVAEAVAKFSGNQELQQQSNRKFQELVALEPLNPKLHQALAVFYVRNGEFSKAYAEQYAALQLAPYNWNYYEALLKLAGKAARAGKFTGAEARQALQAYEEIQLRRQALQEKGIPLRRRFNYTETMHLAAAQLAFQLGDYDRCARLAGLVVNSENKKAQLLAVAYVQLCNTHSRQSAQETGEPQETISPAPDKQLNAIQQLPQIK